MNSTQLPFLVEGIILLAAIVFGALLGRAPKPYGKVKLGFHLFFFLWFTMGYYFVAQVIFTDKAWTGVGVAVMVMGLSLLVQIVSGVMMLARKERAAWLPRVHGISASLVLLVDVVTFFLAGTKA